MKKDQIPITLGEMIGLSNSNTNVVTQSDNSVSIIYDNGYALTEPVKRKLFKIIPQDFTTVYTGPAGSYKVIKLLDLTTNREFSIQVVADFDTVSELTNRIEKVISEAFK